LIFDEAALFLDHQDVLQPFGKTSRAALLKRPGQCDLVDAQADFLRISVGNTEVRQRLPQIQIGLAGGDDAKPRRFAVEHDAIELVGAGECRDGVHLRAVQPSLLFERRVGPPDTQSARGHFEVGRQHQLYA
jgi:hypothetical protein